MLAPLLSFALAGAAPPPQPPAPAHAATAAATLGNNGYGLRAGYRGRTRRGFSGGLELESVYLPEAFLGGFAVPNDVRLAVRAPLQMPVLRATDFEMAVTLAPGLRWTRALEDAEPHAQSLAVTADVGVFAYLHRPRFSWMAGLDSPFSIQLDPIRDLDLIGTLLATGPIVPINDRLNWYATLEGGGVFGSNGDAGKFLVRGTTGIRAFFGPGRARWRAFY